MYYPTDSLTPIDDTQQQTMTVPLVTALILHGLLILGVGFIADFPEPTLTPRLDITLVQTHSEQAPEKADYLAQANQQASGSSDEANRPRSPLASTQISEQGDFALESVASAPQDTQRVQPQLLTTKGETFNHISKQPEKAEEPAMIDDEKAEESREIAQLLAEMDEDERRYARRPRIHFIDAISAKSAVEAAYIDTWVKKIERIGNVNFPQEAIQRNLSGKLILNATLDHAGRVVDIKIDVSSGYRALDNAALRIVQLASPYPPLPATIRQKWDQLNITRTWIFHGQDGQGALATE